MMNEEIPTQRPTVPELLQRVATQNERIRVLRENIETETQRNKSYLNTLSGYYGPLSWWRKALIDMAFMTASYVTLVFLALPVLLILPIAGLYWIGSFFLTNHDDAHSLNTASLRLLESTLTESINALTNSQTLLDELTAETTRLNEALDRGADTLAAQNERLGHANTVFEGANETLAPLISTLRDAARDTQKNSQAIIAIINQIHQALGLEVDTLIHTTVPSLNTTLAGLQQSRERIDSTHVNYQERLAHLNTLIQILSDHIDNRGTRTETPENQPTTAEVIQASRDARVESDAIMAQAKIDFDVFNQRNAGLGFFDGPGTPVAVAEDSDEEMSISGDY